MTCVYSDENNNEMMWLFVDILLHTRNELNLADGVFWSLTLRKEHRFRVFGNRVLRRIFGPKREEVTGGDRKFHNEKRHKLKIATSDGLL
jgi:hypothetical protein